MQPKSASFGKRGSTAQRAQVARPRAGQASVELSSTGVPISELAKTLMVSTGGGSDAPVSSKSAGQVPRSWRAAILAGAAVSCLNAGFVILKAKNGSAEMGAMLQMAGVDEARSLPILLAASLWTGSEAAATTVLFAHSGLKRIGQSSILAYALAGAAVTGIFTALTQALGMGGGEYGWPIEIATGAAAGFFYRVFAGARG